MGSILAPVPVHRSTTPLGPDWTGGPAYHLLPTVIDRKMRTV